MEKVVKGELESTYRFVQTVKPELLTKTFAEAKTALQEHLEEVEAAKTHQEAIAMQTRGEDGRVGSVPVVANSHNGKPDRTPTNKLSSTSQQRILSRLKRDASTPDAPNHEKAKEAVEKIQSGEWKSARKAGIHAGIVRVPNVLEQLRKLWTKATAEEKDTLLDTVDLEDLRRALERRK